MISPYLLYHHPSLPRTINAGKSILNEDQASCELLYVNKLSDKKQRNSTLLDDNGVRLPEIIEC